MPFIYTAVLLFKKMFCECSNLSKTYVLCFVLILVKIICDTIVRGTLWGLIVLMDTVDDKK